jgi:hypothetical protein
MPLSFGKWRPVESCKPCQGASPDGSGPVERGEQCSLVVTRRSCRPGAAMNFATKSCASHSAWASRPCPPSPSSIMAWAGASSSPWTTRPATYVEPYQDPRCSRVDPVMQHCKRQSVPIIWDQETYIEKGAADLWEQQASFGYRTGIAMACTCPRASTSNSGWIENALPTDPEELQRLVADLQLFAVHAQDSAMRLLVPGRTARTTGTHAARTGGPALDDGWQDRLGSRRRVGHQRAHRGLSRQQCPHKLGCINKQQAVLKALSARP